MAEVLPSFWPKKTSYKACPSLITHVQPTLTTETQFRNLKITPNFPTLPIQAVKWLATHREWIGAILASVVHIGTLPTSSQIEWLRWFGQPPHVKDKDIFQFATARMLMRMIDPPTYITSRVPYHIHNSFDEEASDPSFHHFHCRVTYVERFFFAIVLTGSESLCNWSDSVDFLVLSVAVAQQAEAPKPPPMQNLPNKVSSFLLSFGFPF